MDQRRNGYLHTVGSRLRALADCWPRYPGNYSDCGLVPFNNVSTMQQTVATVTLQQSVATAMLFAAALAASYVLKFARYYSVSRNVFDAAFGALAAIISIGLFWSGLSFWAPS